MTALIGFNDVCRLALEYGLTRNLARYGFIHASEVQKAKADLEIALAQYRTLRNKEAAYRAGQHGRWF